MKNEMEILEINDARLYQHFEEQHDLMLVEGEMHEIERLVLEKTRTHNKCEFPSGDCLVPQPRISQCPVCHLQIVTDGEECPVCLARAMTARYGARMKYFEECLKYIANFPDDIEFGSEKWQEIEKFAQAKLKFYGHFNLQEIFADSLLLLGESSRVFSLIVAESVDWSELAQKEILCLLETTKYLVKKYETMGEINDKP